MTSPRNDPRAAMENELLARLGLTRDANTQDIEAAHDDVIAFLESAPEGLRDWAKHEIAAADEAYALLFDPTAAIPMDKVIVATAPAAAAEAAVVTSSAKAARVAPGPVAEIEDVDVDDEEAEILADEPVPTRPVRKGTARAAAVPAAAPVDNTARNRLLTRLGLVGAGLVGVAALVIAVYSFGGGGSGVPGMNGTPAPESQAGAGEQTGVDTAAVAALMQQLQADPGDTAAMQQLADLYYQAGDFATAGTFFDKIIAVEPENVNALLGRGATAYNVGDQTLAEKDWRAVIAIDPKNQDAHYYLGFMYLDSEAPDMEKVKAEWNAAIEIAPDSDIAKSIQQHLDSLSALPSASTGVAAPSASPTAAPSETPAP
ncbi:MAG: tetratricopeptide repeat protein [Chloroflexi bacterium]|jgi:cytochrome c-type biogenesis protein CcmH/NrfG|nr:tetratricopeptide repeat protein [Chloroflexota bacterium]